MINLNNLFENYYLDKTLTPFLKWYEILPLLLLTKNISNHIHHPFIKNAIKYYKNKDGIKLTTVEAYKLLEVTRKYQGSELIETVILENYNILNRLSNMDLDTSVQIINSGLGIIDINNEVYKNVDYDIKKAIEYSRCTMYQHYLKMKNSYEAFKSLELSNIMYNYEHEYIINTSTGKIATYDTQINVMVNKTNMPINYIYFFVFTFIKQRLKTLEEFNLLNLSNK